MRMSLHALTDAISGITGRTVIGKVADDMCRQGVTDSKEYLKVALADLGDWQLSHVSIALEGKRPKIDPKVPALRKSIAGLLDLSVEDVCITATTGEGLNEVGPWAGLARLGDCDRDSSLGGARIGAAQTAQCHRSTQQSGLRRANQVPAATE